MEALLIVQSGVNAVDERQPEQRGREMLPAAVISRKRDGEELTGEQIAAFVDGICTGEWSDSQVAAMAMAVVCRGMTDQEVSLLTEQMLNSGARLQWADDGRPVVDKHSTGGTGDKTSLILAPLLADCGCRVPMISGRGLGPTGGTLDKLEAIPGFRTQLSASEMQEQVDRIGCVIASASSEIAPADRRLYTIRDVTGTVPSVPLITASIMSKKLAESPQALMLDVKWGNGAFMKTPEDAQYLARSLVETGRRSGVSTTAFLTDMNQPLGQYCGNACEVLEAIEILQGRGPEDLRLLTIELAIETILLAGLADGHEAAENLVSDSLASGRAWEKFLDMVEAQGGSREFELKLAAATEISAECAGVISAIDTEAIALGLIELGAGRRQTGDQLDHSSGIRMHVRLGDAIAPGQPLMTVFSDRPEAARDRLRSSIRTDDCGIAPALIGTRISTRQ